MVAQAPDRLYRSPPEYPQPRLMDTPAGQYLFLRSVLAPQYAALPAEQLAAVMESEYGPGAAEQYDEYFEGFFGDVGNFFKKAAPVVANIAGGVVKGATTGASFGLPGIFVGAVTGGVGQGLASYGSGTLRDIGKGINTGIGVAGQFIGTGRIGSALGGALSGIGQGKNVLTTAVGAASSLAGGALGGGLGGGALGQLAGLAGGRGGYGGAISSLAGLAGGQGGYGGAISSLARLAGGQGGLGGAVSSLAGLAGGQPGSSASQLLSMLQRPEVMQSLGALAMGPAGRPTVPVGSAQTPVPTNAIASMLGLLLNRAVDEQAALSDGSESDLGYLTNTAGEWVVDPSESDQRAALIYELLNAAANERLVQVDQQLRMQQFQQQQHQQHQLQQQVAYQQQLQQAREWEHQQEIEAALYEAMDLAEAYGVAEDLGEYDEHDEYDEYEEYASA